MPFNGSGTFNRLKNWVLEAAQGYNILPDHMDTDTNDIAAGLSMCITKDGQQVVSADIPFNSFKVTQLADPASAQDGVNLRFLQSYTAGLYAPLISPPLAGIPTAPTAAPGTNTNQIATMAALLQQAFNSALPNQTGNADKMVTTDGSSASWSDLIKVGTVKLADSSSTTKRAQFILSGITAGQTRTLTLRDRNAVLGPDMQLDTRVANTQLTVADIGKFIDVTTAGFTQTFDTFANLQGGWWVILRNSDATNDITIPSSDGVTNWKMYPGEARLFQNDGTKLTSIVLRPYRKRFPSSTTWIKAPGYSLHGHKVGSGGASGERSGGASGARGGCGGGAFAAEIPSSLLGATETVTIGAGGAQVTTTALGNTGGTSSFGSWTSVLGGTCGNSGSANLGGALSMPSGTRCNQTGTVSGAVSFGFETSIANGPWDGIWAGGKSDTSVSAASGGSVFGGGAGGSVDGSGNLRASGVSRFEGSGGAAGDAANGSDGAGPCAGGGATRTGTHSGAGKDGFVDTWGVV